MNFAIPAFFIILLILPGFIFRYGYLTGFVRTPYQPGQFSYEIVSSLCYAIVLHLLWIGASCLYCQYFNCRINVEIINGIIFNSWGEKDIVFAELLDSFKQIPCLLGYILYFMTIFILPFYLGRFFFNVVRYCLLDLSSTHFRFKNDWYYLLTGEQLFFQEFNYYNDIFENRFNNIIDRLKNLRNRKFSKFKNWFIKHCYKKYWMIKKIHFFIDNLETYIDVVISHNNGEYIYSGFLLDYHFKSGQIDHLVLITPQKTLIQDNRKSVFIDIPSDRFVIRYADAKTLNVRYKMPKI